MEMFIQIRTITAEEVLQREVYEGSGREIINGEWAEATKMAGEQHGFIGATLVSLLFPYVRQHKLGRVYQDNTNYVLEGTPENILTMRIPDVSFITASRLQPLQEGYLYLAPDLAIEVVSPTETKRDTQEKIDDYLRFGTQEIWVIYPEEQRVMVYSPQNKPVVYSVEDTLTSPLLGDFQLPIAQVFEE